MKIELNKDVLTFLNSQGYKYFLTKVKYDQSLNKLINIDLIPLTREPGPDSSALMFDTYFSIDRSPEQVFADIGDTRINICLCAQDMIKFKRFSLLSLSEIKQN